MPLRLGDWTVNRLSDGSRDAHQDVNRGMQNGGWAVIWQEDPRGLQPGEAEGPGDGASGARVSLGTDVWYTYSGPSKSSVEWKTPVRLTDNWTASAGKPGGGPVVAAVRVVAAVGSTSATTCRTPPSGQTASPENCAALSGIPYSTASFLTVGDVDWYLQQDQHNEWQAETLDAMAAGITPFSVDQIDWGDNLEARDWPASSQVRVETVLYSAPADAMTGFEMGYLFGEGSTEMWGANGFTYRTDAADAASDPRKSAVATVYSRCARLTIQKLIGTRENPGLARVGSAARPVDRRRGGAGLQPRGVGGRRGPGRLLRRDQRARAPHLRLQLAGRAASPGRHGGRLPPDFQRRRPGARPHAGALRRGAQHRP